MSAEPWSKFFWSDYDADEGLRLCSLAAQGLWMRMLCLMARATPKGDLRVGGEPCTVSDLSRAVGETEETVAALLGELHRRGVSSTTRAGVIFSRRIRKDAEISRKRAKSGAIGAAVKYGRSKENQVCHGKTVANEVANSSLQKPEARSQTTLPLENGNGAGAPPDPEKVMFDAGVALLTATGKSESQARTVIGKWKRDHDPERIIVLLGRAQREGAIDPVGWIEGALRSQKRAGNRDRITV